MYKIFLVKKGTKMEEEVKKLIEKGCKYLPKFEQEAKIVGFCMDLEVISDDILDPNLYVVIDGFEENINYQNENLEEITIEQFKSSLKKGYSISRTGTNQLIETLGYKSTPYNEYLRKIEVV